MQLSFNWASFLEHFPQILKAASQDTFSMIAFFSSLLAIIALIFFKKEDRKVKLGIFAALLLGFSYLIFFFVRAEQNYPDTIDSVKTLEVEYIKKSPKIIGIYPKDIFGVNQKEGLVAAQNDYNNGIDLIHLDFLSYTELKSGRIEKLEDTLDYLLEHENILAIVGPPITESVDEVLNLLFDKNTKIPIFNTSAASKQYLNWPRLIQKLNLFRIGTGTDDRAKSMADFLKKHSSGIKKTLILLETNPDGEPTYGETFLHELNLASPEFVNYTSSGEIVVEEYSRTDMQTLNDAFRDNYKHFNAVFLFGVGTPYRWIIDNFYRGAISPDSLPKFGGYMFGYALNDELESNASNIVNNRVFEITDLDLLATAGLGPSTTQRVFTRGFGELHPGLRDEASYFDVGICINEAYNQLLSRIETPQLSSYPSFTGDAVSELVKILKSTTYDGVSGPINFDKNGQNTRTILRTAVFDSERNEWNNRIGRDSIMNLE